MDVIQPYNITVAVMGLIGFTLLLQLLVADVAMLAGKHTPGFPVEADHSQFLFRASRALANTNESIAIFLSLALFAMLSQASPDWVNGSALAYAAGRLGHMAFYYTNSMACRSIAFGVSLMGLSSLLAAGMTSFFGS